MTAPEFPQVTQEKRQNQLGSDFIGWIPYSGQCENYLLLPKHGLERLLYLSDVCYKIGGQMTCSEDEVYGTSSALNIGACCNTLSSTCNYATGCDNGKIVYLGGNTKTWYDEGRPFLMYTNTNQGNGLT